MRSELERIKSLQATINDLKQSKYQPDLSIIEKRKN